MATQAGLLDDRHYGFAMADDGMLYWLARAAKQLREQAGRKQVHIAAEMSIDQASVYRFERNGVADSGRRIWPKNPDEVVRAYAGDLDIGDPIDIWALAIAMWREERDLPELVDQVISGGVGDELAGPVEELARADGRRQPGSARAPGGRRRGVAG